jgi:hypothetical protein
MLRTVHERRLRVVRILDGDCKELKKLKKVLKISTFNKLIKFLLRRYDCHMFLFCSY